VGAAASTDCCDGIVSGGGIGASAAGTVAGTAAGGGGGGTAAGGGVGTTAAGGVGTAAGGGGGGTAVGTCTGFVSPCGCPTVGAWPMTDAADCPIVAPWHPTVASPNGAEWTTAAACPGTVPTWPGTPAVCIPAAACAKVCLANCAAVRAEVAV